MVSLETPRQRAAFWLKLSVLTLLFIVLIPVGALALLQAKPNELKPLLEKAVSRALERELRVGQLLNLNLGWDTSITARDVSLANPAWADSVDFVRLQHLHIKVHLPALWQSNLLLVSDLEMRGIELDLQAPGQHPPNWEFKRFDRAEKPEGAEALISTLFANAKVTDAEVRYRDEDQDFIAQLERLLIQEQRNDEGIKLDLKGSINAIPLTAEGQVGPASSLLTQENLNLDLTVNWGQLEVQAQGDVADLFALSGANLQVRVVDPNPRALLDVLGMPEVTAGALQFEGQITDENPGMAVVARGTLGDFDLSVSGSIAAPLKLDGIETEFALSGPSLAEAGAMFDVVGLQDVAFDLSGQLSRTDSGLHLQKSRLIVGDGQLILEGHLPAFPQFEDWQVSLEGAGFNLARLGPLLGVSRLPDAPSDISLRLGPSPEGKEILHLSVQAADARLLLNGTIGAAPEFLGSQVTIEFTGSDLDAAASWLGVAELPSQKFQASGKLSIDPEGWHLRGSRIETGGITLGFSGELDRFPGPTAVDAQVSAGTDDLAASLKTFGFEFLQLPGFPLSFTGHISGSPDLLHVTDAEFISGETRMTTSGQVSDVAALESLDLAVSIDSPDVMQFLPQENAVARPSFPIAARGNIALSTAGIQVRNLRGYAGAGHIPFSLALDGSYEGGKVRVSRLEAVVADNRLEGQLDIDNLDQPYSASGKIEMSGASSKDLADLLRVDLPAPDSEYTFTTVFKNSSESLQLSQSSLFWGKKDYDGDVTVHWGDVPRFDADLHSKFLDLSFLMPDVAALEKEQKKSQSEFDPAILKQVLKGPELAERIIPDSSIDVGWMNKLNGSLRYRIEEMYLQDGVTLAADMDIAIEDGVLTSRHLSWAGTLAKGKAELTLRAESDTAAIEVYLDMERTPLVFLLGGEREDYPGSLYRARLSTRGNSLREWAGNLDGILAFTDGGGRLNNKTLDLVTNDAIENILERLNPFSKSDEYTTLVCYAGALTIEDGTVVIEPGLVLRTDKMDLATTGSIGLDKENLDLAFTTRSRTGVGLNIRNTVSPYLRIGGTLANPRLGLDVTGAALSGGAAFFTGGLSIVAEGLLNRWVTTARDPCRQLLIAAVKENEKTFAPLLTAPLP